MQYGAIFTYIINTHGSDSLAATSYTHLQTCVVIVEHMGHLRCILLTELGGSEGIGQVLTDTYCATWPVASGG